MRTKRPNLLQSPVSFRFLLIRLKFTVFRSEPCILTACYGKILVGIWPMIKNNRVCTFSESAA